MREVDASVEVAAPLAEVWELYFDPRRWRSWVDGFAAVASRDGYPERGGRLSWRSTPAGRGTVNEQVLLHEPRSLHRIAYRDPESSGELETRFEMQPAPDEQRRTRVVQRLAYEFAEAGPLGPITDWLFIRSQMRRSLERSLAQLRAEAEGARPAGARQPD